MYDLVDQPVERLCNGGRFLLWAARGWASATASGTCPPAALSRGFAGVDALSALSDFHIAMSLLNRDALEPLELAPMRCKTVSEDEAILSGLWRDVSLGRADRLRTTLELLVDEEAVAPVTRAMTATMARLALAGLDLVVLDPETQKEGK